MRTSLSPDQVNWAIRTWRYTVGTNVVGHGIQEGMGSSVRGGGGGGGTARLVDTYRFLIWGTLLCRQYGTLRPRRLCAMPILPRGCGSRRCQKSVNLCITQDGPWVGCGVSTSRRMVRSSFGSALQAQRAAQSGQARLSDPDQFVSSVSQKPTTNQNQKSLSHSSPARIT